MICTGLYLRRFGITGLTVGFLSAAVGAQDVMVVLSSDGGPYHEALTGFIETSGQPGSIINLAQTPFPEPPHGAIVVAIGAKTKDEYLRTQPVKFRSNCGQVAFIRSQ